MKTKQTHFYVCLACLSDKKYTDKETESISHYYICII